MKYHLADTAYRRGLSVADAEARNPHWQSAAEAIEQAAARAGSSVGRRRLRPPWSRLWVRLRVSRGLSCYRFGENSAQAQAKIRR
ncbi:MAG: hypothetical protein ACREXR_02635 [Gammaproteobacteria bacterium]